MSKYHNKRTIIDNVSFASRAEAQRYTELKMLHETGVIGGLTLQPVYVLQDAFKDVSGVKHRSVTYVGDFAYVDCETGNLICEDVKGFMTPVFRIKQTLFLKLYPHVELRVLKV